MAWAVGGFTVQRVGPEMATDGVKRRGRLGNARVSHQPRGPSREGKARTGGCVPEMSQSRPLMMPEPRAVCNVFCTLNLKRAALKRETGRGGRLAASAIGRRRYWPLQQGGGDWPWNSHLANEPEIQTLKGYGIGHLLV